MSIWTTPEREQLRKTVRAFAEREVLPHVDEWEQAGMLPRELHRKAGEAGLLGAGLPEAVGGGGGDGADSLIICEEMHYSRGAGRGFRVAVHLRHRGAAHDRLGRPATDRHVGAAHAARREDRHRWRSPNPAAAPTSAI